MALNINTNIGALGAAAAASSVNKSMETAMERLSTGLRINTAADDAAGVSISTRMEAQIRGLNQAIRNSGDGQSMVDTAEGAMVEITNMLQRMRELSLQASNSINNPQDRAALNAEVSQLVAEIDRIANQTKFNDQRILDGSFSGQIQAGKDAGDTITFQVSDVSAGSLGRTALTNSSLAIVEAKAQGTVATETVARLSFSGPDSYSFKVSGISVAATLSTATMTTDMRNLATTINNNLTSAGVTNITAEAKNGVIELRNTQGDNIAVTNFSSTGNGTAQFDIISGGGDSVHLNDATAVQTSTTALGTESSSTGVTLKLEAAKAFSFKVNGASVDIATTDNAAAIKAKLEAALGSGYEVFDSATNASAALAAAGTGFTAGQVTGIAADEFIIFNNTAGKAVNITQFQGLGAREAGTAGTIRVAGNGTEALLIDGTNQFTVADATAGNATEIDLAFNSTSSDYQMIIDGQAVLITGDDLAAGTAGAKLIADLNSLGANSGFVVGGLGSLGNTSDAAADGTGDFGDTTLTAINYEIVQNGSSINIKKTGGDGDITAKIVVDAAEVGAATNDLITGESVSANAPALVVGTGVAAFEAVAAPTGSFFVNDDTTGAKVAASVVNLNETGAAVFQTQTATATKATLATSGNGTYNFKITDNTNTTGLITTAVAGGSAAQMVADINAATTAAGINTVATLDPNDSTAVILTNSDGKAVKLTTFSSPSSETILFSPSAGQGQAIRLDDNTYLASATATAAGLADATTANMTFSGDDFTSFKISDGVATATVRRVSTDSAAQGAALQTEVRSALTAAGITDITVSATAANGKTTLSFTNSKGGVIDISDFKTDASVNATFSPASGQGAARILDDNGTNNASGLSVADIDISAVNSASSALEIIDNALQQVNDERANLGAISNRLNYAIDNMTNVAINTAAAQSRIQDADFAAESTNLAKAQILQQASMAMLAQANASKQGVLQLLQG